MKPIHHKKTEELPDAYFMFAKRGLGVFHFITGHNPNIARHFGNNKDFLKALFSLIPEKRYEYCISYKIVRAGLETF